MNWFLKILKVLSVITKAAVFGLIIGILIKYFDKDTVALIVKVLDPEYWKSVLG